MPEVLDIRETKSAPAETLGDSYSWKVELPDLIKKENSLSENAYLVLTVCKGKISAEIINVTVEIKSEVNRISGKYRKTFEEMKGLGD